MEGGGAVDGWGACVIPAHRGWWILWQRAAVSYTLANPHPSPSSLRDHQQPHPTQPPGGSSPSPRRERVQHLR